MFGEDPVVVARRFAAEGASIVHVVDLDGAFAGEPRQLAIVSEIAKVPGLEVLQGGGLRTAAHVRAALDRGVARVVIGSALFSDGAEAAELAAAFPERIVAAIDAAGGIVRTHGWTGSSGLSVDEAAARVRALGIGTALCTDISRDGTMTGPNVALARQVARAVPDVIVSGGVRTADDVTACREAGAWGVILGMALYTGAVALPDALRRASP